MNSYLDWGDRLIGGRRTGQQASRRVRPSPHLRIFENGVHLFFVPKKVPSTQSLFQVSLFQKKKPKTKTLLKGCHEHAKQTNAYTTLNISLIGLA